MTAERSKPGWVTQIGVLASLGLAFAAFNKNNGKQEAATQQALERADKIEALQQQKTSRMYDIMRAEDRGLRSEIETAKSDLRREMDLSCRCRR